MKQRLPGVLCVLVLAGALAYSIAFKDLIRVALVVPEGYRSGVLVVVTATYAVDGKQQKVEYLRRLLVGEQQVTVKLPFRLPWTFRDLSVDISHPYFRPARAYAGGNPHWYQQTVEVIPDIWSKDLGYDFVKPDEQTSVQGLMHLRWLNEQYLKLADAVTVNGALLTSKIALASLAYAGGEKPGSWEFTRRYAIAEYTKLEATLAERLFEPCPEGFEPDLKLPPVCGREQPTVVWPN